MKEKTIEKWFMGFQFEQHRLGFEKNNYLGNGIRAPPPPPSRPSIMGPRASQDLRSPSPIMAPGATTYIFRSERLKLLQTF